MGPEDNRNKARYIAKVSIETAKRNGFNPFLTILDAALYLFLGWIVQFQLINQT